jgi:all-trans-8'-apo-beta-carotenal 15,15'-oxygenase
MTTSPTKSYSRQDWQKGYESQPQESEYWVEDITGVIPAGLEGTLWRNGPGLLDINGTPIRHPFDGDGMISAITFRGGKVHFRNRFVQTEAYRREQAEGKILYRGVFGTQKPGGWLNNIFDLRLKNIANTNVLYWNKKLLALWEAAEPHHLHPKTLETIGLDYLGGILQPGDAFSAHPRIDPTQEPILVNFAIKPGLSSKITIYEIDTQGKLLSCHSHSVAGFCFIHDFVITPNYCIFFQNPVTYNPFPFLLGWRGAGECLQYQPQQPTRILLIPRRAPYEDITVVETPAGFVFHHANAFEREGQVCIDSICYESLPQINPDTPYQDVDFDSLDPGQLWRFTVNLEDKTAESKMLQSRCVEFPVIHPDYVGREHRYVYLGTAHNSTGNAPLQGVIKFDLVTGESWVHSFAPRGFTGEPIFVPKPQATSEDDGWLLCMVYDAEFHRSDVVILDALDFTPIASVHLKQHIPYGLHGSWVGECF